MEIILNNYLINYCLICTDTKKNCFDYLKARFKIGKKTL